MQQSNANASVSTLVYRETADLGAAVARAAPGTLVIDRKGKTAGALDIANLLATTGVSLFLRN